MDQPTRYILTVDGGGIRGLMPALILRSLEQRIAAICAARGTVVKPLYQYFDLMGGTSTGGIIVAGLSAPGGKPGEAACTPADLVSIYADQGREIFPDLWFKTLRGLFGPVYSPEPLQRILRERLGEARLSAALTDVVLCAYDTVARRARFMAGGPGYRTDPTEADYRTRDAARGTSAAPTYFPPAHIEELAPVQTKRTLIDGGVFANDPSLATYIEAMKLGWRGARIEMLSLGTGSQNRPYRYHLIDGWGAISWLLYGGDHPLISILMQGASSTTAYQMDNLLNQGPEDRCYTRIDGALDGVSDALDDASPANIAAIERLVGHWLEQKNQFEPDKTNDELLEGWARRLADRP